MNLIPFEKIKVNPMSIDTGSFKSFGVTGFQSGDVSAHVTKDYAIRENS